MSYTKQLPYLGELWRLSQLAIPYPASRNRLLWLASQGEFGDDVTDFLLQFPASRVFISAADFMDEAENLEILINQEWNSPAETLHSPQG